MKSSKINLIILGLTVTLAIITWKTFDKVLNTKQNKNNSILVESKFKEIDAQSLIDKLKSENSMNVLSGNVKIKATYDDKKINEDDINYSWLKDKLLDCKVKFIENEYDVVNNNDVEVLEIDN